MAVHIILHGCENLALHYGDKGRSERAATKFFKIDAGHTFHR